MKNLDFLHICGLGILKFQVLVIEILETMSFLAFSAPFCLRQEKNHKIVNVSGSEWEKVDFRPDTTHSADI